ncbi:uncharacterized protein AMSG_08800 [Thecamonas trahens ATCC 50062]|uniref:Uncharacterized protein n=1 Tax=Thecamonas trahens ATCC 50062 TaxID=461836 RepID=A0A0L0DMN9_THETB|nr:hypothetical protein AMSG_08800 [Thecamonas trahens ATCC 50062]KNC53306.1 hypothetical protein AMSG_08800 [Thecamonas trahens ATCC 50062]|eukprot:XP_013754567.1 hypothetical protein AMSG_08800 [Thecamonas trahens ATCC 50062]
MGCGSSRDIPPASSKSRNSPRPARPRTRRSSSSSSSSSHRGRRSGDGGRRLSRTSSTTSISSGLPGTDTSSDNLSASDEALLDRIASRHDIDVDGLSAKERKELLNCTFRPATNKRSARLAARARARTGGRGNKPIHDRLARRPPKRIVVTYRPTKDEAFLTYVKPGEPGAEHYGISVAKRKMIRSHNNELNALSQRLKDGTSGTGPSTRSSSYRQVIDKINHLNRTIGIITAALEQAEHKLFYSFEEWYEKEYAHLPPPPSPRSHAAASRIQALYRGYAVRKRPPTPYHLRASPEAHEAATRIQAVYRGYAARRRHCVGPGGYHYGNDDPYGDYEDAGYYDDGPGPGADGYYDTALYPDGDDDGYGEYDAADGGNVPPYDMDYEPYPYSDDER